MKKVLMILSAMLMLGCSTPNGKYQSFTYFEDLFTFEYTGKIESTYEKETTELGNQTMYSSKKAIGQEGDMTFVVEYLDEEVLTMEEYNGSDIDSMKNMLKEQYAHFVDFTIEDVTLSNDSQSFQASYVDPFDEDERKMFLYAKNPSTDEYAKITLSFKKNGVDAAKEWMSHAIQTFTWNLSPVK